MTRELSVGLVFVVLLGFLLGATLWIDDPGFIGDDPAVLITAEFDDVGGLTKGSDVWVNGIETGRVQAVRLNDKGGVSVDVALLTDPGLRKDAAVAIRSSSALGGMVIAIDRGTPTAGPWAGGALVGESASGGPFGEIGDLVAEIRGPLSEAVTNLNKITKDFSERSESISENADVFLENAREISAGLRDGQGTLGKLLNDDSVYTELEEAVASFRKIADDANGGGGTIDMLLHDQELASDLKGSVSDLRSVAAKLESGDGTLGKLLNDPALYDNLTAASSDLRGLVADAKSGEGLLARLVYDDELGQRVDLISRDVKQITGKLRRGEGTLGRLIQDEELYTDLRDALRSLKGGSAAVRENAPILTFTGFLLNGF